jgi:hypothetical protein
MDKEQPVYFSYLLRIWREGNNEMLHQVDEAPDHTERRPIWLASLENSLGSQRQGFANLEALFAFLRQQTGTVSDSKSKEARAKGQEADHWSKTAP